MESVEEAIRDARTVANIRLHRSPFVPDEQDAAIITRKAQALRELEKEIDDEFLRVFAKKKSIQAQVAIHDALTAPCRRLPPELLSEIFLLALPERWKDEYAGKRSLGYARVCRSWRDVALKTPRLWSRLRFDATTNCLARHTSAVQAELDKTGQVPLELHLAMEIEARAYFPDPPPTMDKVWSDDAWALLHGQSHRWEEVWLEGIPMRAYDDLVGDVFPALRDLSICLGETDEEMDLTVPLHAFQSAPKLTSFYLSYKQPIRTLTLPRSWSLTTLNIYCGECDELVLAPCLGAILACSGTLRELYLTADEDFADLPIGLKPASFPRLEVLDLRYNAMPFCDFIAALPCLRSLRLSSTGERDPFDMLHNILDKSAGGKSLRTLSLQELESPDAAHILGCLRRLPQLTELELQNYEDFGEEVTPLITLDLIIALTRDTARPTSLTLLPNLTRLEISFNGMEPDAASVDLFKAAMLELLNSRRRARAVDGMDLALLEFCSTDGPGRGNVRWPPREGETSQDNGLEDSDMDM
ncbi:hypothetical protein BD626DRAFT_430862 [Schizophyllum amplum]|uniref:Uncharacterized protein n=1 Tax=Schizophyllum amplum TaxID=97359 RepID=A0A550CGV9_9AGAR|nr:hypothetical protein BD626DRAFT_430862 [Auriculariopsis ampla]